MDYLTVDSARHLLYVPRSTHTLVIDAVSGKTVGDIPGQKENHGVAIVPKLNRGFITDGAGEGSITIFDLKTNAILGVIKAQPDADGIIYDEGADRILVSAGDSNTLITFKPEIDPKSGKIESADPTRRRARISCSRRHRQGLCQPREQRCSSGRRSQEP